MSHLTVSTSLLSVLPSVSFPPGFGTSGLTSLSCSSPSAHTKPCGALGIKHKPLHKTEETYVLCLIDLWMPSRQTHRPPPPPSPTNIPELFELPAPLLSLTLFTLHLL